MPPKALFFAFGAVSGFAVGCLMVHFLGYDTPPDLARSAAFATGHASDPVSNFSAESPTAKRPNRRSETPDFEELVDSRKQELARLLNNSAGLQLRDPKLIAFAVLHGLQREFIAAMRRQNDPGPCQLLAAEWHSRDPWSFDLAAFGEGDFRRRATIGMAASVASSDPTRALRILEEIQPAGAGKETAIAHDYAFVFGDLPNRAASENMSRWLLQQDPTNPRWRVAYKRLLYNLAQSDPSEVRLFLQEVADPEVKQALAYSSANGAIQSGRLEDALPLIAMAAAKDQEDLKVMLETKRRELSGQQP